MKQSIIAGSLLLLALLSACGGKEARQLAINSDPPPQIVQSSVNHTMQGQLPPVSALDGLRGASTLFSSFTIIASSNATVGGGGELTLDAPAGGFAWIVFDLGNQVPDFSIGQVEFTNASWGAINPAPKVFVGISDYTAGFWRFRQAMVDTHIASFANLPPGIDFVSPGGRSYLAIITGSAGLSFGNDIDIAAAAGPGGELPADYVLAFPGMPDKFGLNNAIVVRPDNSGGDIVTYCPDNNGGAIVRFGYNSGTDTLTTTVLTLFDAGAGQPLAGCFVYKPDYYTDGRLGIGAARTGPNAIREVRELSPNSLDFGFGSFQTALSGTDGLPTNFSNPQYDYKIDADNEPHCLFLTSAGTLGYAYYVAGSWGIDTGGPQTTGNISMRLLGGDTIVAYQAENGGDRKIAINRMLQYPLGIDFGSSADVTMPVLMMAGEGISMAIGVGDSIHIAHRLFDGGNGQLDFAYRPNAVIGDTWTNTTADNGGVVDDDLGAFPSLGILSDGTPVVAYFDITNLSLRLAISSTPDGGNVTGGTWDSYRIDTSVLGSQVGLNPALGVIQRTAPDPDKVIVAYGVQDGSAVSMRIILLDAPAPAV